ncbi:SPOCS domain-containing protein [Proteinivorax hydrogeniformans]|uniref:SPOCS domain-containing protein n=1 Tax=Proteinivorax hydrogeniformans TaxID=1826727 RepID=A0AAU8HTV5_9FIRM
MEQENLNVEVINEPVCLNQVIGEEINQISLTEEINLSKKLDKVVEVEVFVPQHKIEVNVLDDKVSVEGKLTRIVYGITLGGDLVEEVLPEMQFSHFIHMQGVQPKDSALVNVTLEDYDGKLNGSETLQEEAKLELFVKVTTTKKVDIFKDIGKDINQTKDLTRIQNLIDQKEVEIPTEFDVEFDTEVSQFIETEAEVIPKNLRVADNNGEIEADIIYRILYRTEDGKLKETKGKEVFSKKVDLTGVDTSMEMWADLKVKHVEQQLKDSKLAATQILTVYCNLKIIETSQMELVTHAENVDTYNDRYTVENIVCEEEESINSQQSTEFSTEVAEIERISSVCKIIENKVLEDKVALNLNLTHIVHYKDEDDKQRIIKVAGENFTHFIYMAGITEDMKALLQTDISDVKVEMTPDSMAATISCQANLKAKVLQNELVELVTDVNVLKDQTHDASVIIYSVQKGDTIFKIAKRFGVRQKEIIGANKENIKDPNQINLGQKLIIPCS